MDECLLDFAGNQPGTQDIMVCLDMSCNVCVEIIGTDGCRVKHVKKVSGVRICKMVRRMNSLPNYLRSIFLCGSMVQIRTALCMIGMLIHAVSPVALRGGNEHPTDSSDPCVAILTHPQKARSTGISRISKIFVELAFVPGRIYDWDEVRAGLWKNASRSSASICTLDAAFLASLSHHADDTSEIHKARVVLRAPRQYIDGVVGEGGDRIKLIRHLSGASIEAMRRPQRYVQIYGRVTSVRVALFMMDAPPIYAQLRTGH